METLISKIVIGLIGAGLVSLFWGAMHLFGNKAKNTESQEKVIIEDDGFGEPGKQWTQKDHRFLINHSDLSNQALANALNRSTGAISAKRSQLGLRDNGHKSKEEATKELEKIEETESNKSKDNSLDKILEEREELRAEDIMEYIDLNQRPHTSNSRSKLSPKDVVKIYISTKNKEKLANKFGVNSQTISDIKSKRYWIWLTEQIDDILNKEKAFIL